jgi:microcystin-dependent protein
MNDFFRNLSLVAFLIPFAGSAQGVFGPQIVPYSGQIEQNNLEATGQKSLRFSLYEADTGGVSIWTEKHDGVALSNGRFTVKLGSVTTIPDHVWVRPNLYLEVAVCLAAACAAEPGADEVKLARQRMLAVPYARYAAYARHAANGNPPGSIIAYWGTEAPPGWMMCDGRAIPDDDQHAALRTLVGATTPNLQNQFLRGRSGARLVGSAEEDSYERHTHGPGNLAGTTNTDTHTHGYSRMYTVTNGAGARIDMGNSRPVHANQTTGSDAHSHTMTLSRGATATSGTSGETRPQNIAVNYIIKL